MRRYLNKRARHGLLAVAVIITCVLIWWTRVYAPLKERGRGLDADLERVALKGHQLKKKVKKLSDRLKREKRESVRNKRLSQIIGQNVSLEESNAVLQATVQKFFESKEIPLKAYKEISPTKWQGYPMGRLEFRLTTNIQGVADVLKFLETLGEPVRIERLQINSRGKKNRELRVSLRLGTLFVRGMVKKGKS